MDRAQPEKQGFDRSGIGRYSVLPPPVKVLYLGTTLAAVLLFVFYWLAVPIGGRVLGGTLYYYLLFAILGFNVFIGLAATHQQSDRPPPWYDYLAAIVLPLLMVFFLLNAEEISMRMWTPAPSLWHIVLALVLGLLALEAGRRVAGKGYVIVILVFIAYSLFASHMPGKLYGFQLSFSDMLSDFAFGANGILGLPAAILGKMVLGFYLFAGVMVGLGGGNFFIKLAVALMGHIRGGPAKVAVLASGFFGMLTGSNIANIAATGSVTIPAMKRMGYPPHYAAAIEACASTGGDIMPPVMGGLAFMAAIITNTDYASVMLAAVIPSVLYYLGLLVQVDGYAAKAGLKGLPRIEIPSVWTTLGEGWPYLVSVAFLVFGLLYMRWGTMAPVYASGLMLVLGFAGKKTRPTWRRLESALASTAGLLNIGMAIFLSIGFLTVSLYKTGLAAGITAWVVSLGGGNVYLILIIGVLFSLVMGMVGLERTAYLFLAVTMAPAVAGLAGVPLIAVHLFLIFYAELGGLTPPVAINAFVAAGIARADGMRTAWTSMRLGSILFFLPLFFVLQPALIMHGTPLEIIYHTAMAAVGIFLLTSGLEGYLLVIGRLNTWSRIALGIAGFLIAFPGSLFTAAGLGLGAATILALKVEVKAAGKRRPH
jgi:TRAP transporter 4TM/12TM fusion protein